MPPYRYACKGSVIVLISVPSLSRYCASSRGVRYEAPGIFFAESFLTVLL